MTELHYLSAAQAIAAFTAKTVSPVELMEAVIQRAASTEEAINALTFTHFDEALAAAKAAEARYMKGAPVGALDGLPIAIKDSGDIAGKPSSHGSLISEGYIANDTSPVNQRILDAGGIVHARSATPEFSCALVTWSKRWGVTRNPWNPTYTPGGSSGGAAAALASGVATLCSGGDIGGSIRVPAATCGLVGYKPPHGRNPGEPPYSLDPYYQPGPLARSVGDAIRLQNVMAGPHPQDIVSLRPKLTLPHQYASIAGWKIAYSSDLGFYQVDPEVRRNTAVALDVFRSLGAEVEGVDLAWEASVLDHGVAHLGHIFGILLASQLSEHATQMTSYARHFATVSAAQATPQKYLQSLYAEGRMYAVLAPILERCRLLVCPTTALPAVRADFDPTAEKLSINGHPVNPFIGWVMTLPFNMLGRLPVLQVPSGYAANGVPTGIQIVGRSYCDADVFSAGLAYEAAVGGFFSATKRPLL